MTASCRSNDSHGPILLGVTGTTLGVAVAMYATRIYVRAYPRYSLRWDDWFITVAMINTLICWGSIAASVYFGLGRHNCAVSPDNIVKASFALFIAQPPWPWSIGLSKASMALTLLRFRHSMRWRIFVTAIIAAQTLFILSVNCAQFLQCRPLATLWDPAHVSDPKCWPLKLVQTSIYANAAVTLASDVALSLVPITFIRTLHRPLREKIVLCFLMGLGLFSASTAAVRMTTIPKYGVGGDTLRDGATMSFWCILEQHMHMLAACIPCLKSLFEKVLFRMGLISVPDLRVHNPDKVYLKAYMSGTTPANHTRPRLETQRSNSIM